MKDDLISRQAAIDALWKALYKYEDETEKQFQESDELDIERWFLHRIFVQNMSDIDRQTILNLPSAQPDKDINVPCTDTISRQAALKCAEMDSEIYIALNNLPSVQPVLISKDEHG